MAAEVEPLGVEGEDYVRVEKNERVIIVPIRKSPDEPYHSDAQIRALQLVQEGRLGGPGRGQGRKRKPRAAEQVAEAVKKRSDKIIAALDAGLDSDSERTRLQAADMALKIEREEAILQLKEDEVDIDQQSKEELVATLIELVGDPSTEAALEAVIDLPPEAITEVSIDDKSNGKAAASKRAESAAVATASRSDSRSNRGNGSRSASRDRAKGANPFTARAHGRAGD